MKAEKKDTESLGFTEEELGGGRGRMLEEGTDGGIYAVAKTHRQTG